MLQPMGLQRAGYDLVTEQQKVLLGQSKHGSESESSFLDDWPWLSQETAGILITYLKNEKIESSLT